MPGCAPVFVVVRTLSKAYGSRMLNTAPGDQGPAGVSSLGERLREERQRLGVSLRGLARDVGVSASMISQIETGKTKPSVSTLYSIVSVLGITMEELFAPRRPESVELPAEVTAVAVGHDAVAVATKAVSRVPAASSAADVAVVRPGDRHRLTLDTGVTWDRLGEIAGQPVDFLLITYPPGATSSSRGGQMRHSGAEFGFVLRGELVLTLGFDEVRLGPGDAVSFPSTTPHSYRNDGTEPAVGVWFVIERDVHVDE
jgi:transcriptional regulator with XRE-family HTH domain/quercetin dioxygenase-like cupin family protein